MEKKTENLHIRIDKATKELAEKKAKEEGRTVSNYIAWLIKKDSE